MRWRAVDWVGGWRSFRAWVSAFVPVGGGTLLLYLVPQQYLFSPLYNRPALAKFEYETKRPFAAVLLQHGGGVGGWLAWSVGGCVVRYLGGVLSAT